jgi:hypothetical protein
MFYKSIIYRLKLYIVKILYPTAYKILDTSHKKPLNKKSIVNFESHKN